MGEAKRRGTNLGRRQVLEIMPTEAAMLDGRIAAAVVDRITQIIDDLAKPPADRLQCFVCAEPWSTERVPECVVLIESLDCAPQGMLGLICDECRAKGGLLSLIHI